MFAARAAGMPPASRRRALAALERGLDADKDALLAPPAPRPPGDAGAAPDGACEQRVSGRLLPGVCAAAWRLAHLGARLDDPGLSGLAARLLAAAGPLPPDVISFSAAAAAGGGGDDVIYMSSTGDDEAGLAQPASAGGSAPKQRSRSTGPGPASTAAVDGAGGGAAAILTASGAASVTGDPRRDAMLFGVLELLGSFLAGPDPEVIGTVQSATRALLATPEGGAALRPLQDALNRAWEAAGWDDAAAAARAMVPCYLSSLAGGAGGAGGDAEAENEEEQQGEVGGGGPQEQQGVELSEPSLWNPAGPAPHGAWLCRLSSALLSACARDPLLRLLAPAAAALPAVAAALLPHALREVVGAGAGRYSDERPVGLPPWQARAELGAAMEAALLEGAAAAAGAAAPPPAGSDVGRSSGSVDQAKGRSMTSSLQASLSRGPSLGAAGGGPARGGPSGAAAGTGADDARQGLRVLLRALEFLRGIHRDSKLTGEGAPVQALPNSGRLWSLTHGGGSEVVCLRARGRVCVCVCVFARARKHQCALV
jgi:hypothetical protein